MQRILRSALLIVCLIFLCSYNCKAEDVYFAKSYDGVVQMLSGKTPINFKKAVILTETAYLEGQIDEKAFNSVIRFYASFCQGIIKSGDIIYTEKDKDVAEAQCGVFTFMTDSVQLSTNEGLAIHPPFEYNFDDYAGLKDWPNTFVSTLIQTNKGNCHSLPYLYKLIMDELGQECHLALAPNHIYIKANNKKVGWYNIELTCSDFPTDAWLMASGYIHIDAIRNKVYMKALTDKEAVAMTLVDLAQGYQAKYGIGDGSFIIKCCDTALEHFPNYINAMLLKGEILTALYKQTPDNSRMEEMNTLYATIHQLGYRKMPTKMYQNWLGSLIADKSDQRMRSVIIKQ